MRTQHGDGQTSVTTPHAGLTHDLFSHPDQVVADGRPGTQPDVQWAHTSLFREAPTG